MRKITHVIELDKIPSGTSQQQGFTTANGFVRTYPKKSLKEARRVYCSALYTIKPPLEPFTGTLKLSLVFLYGTNDKRKKGTYKTTKPDADNLSKVFTDCLAYCGYIENDANIAILSVVKKWSDSSKILFELEEVNNG